jgi:hypothetical protein
VGKERLLDLRNLVEGRGGRGAWFWRSSDRHVFVDDDGRRGLAERPEGVFERFGSVESRIWIVRDWSL